jgi:hypothetical protein
VRDKYAGATFSFTCSDNSIRSLCGRVFPPYVHRNLGWPRKEPFTDRDRLGLLFSWIHEVVSIFAFESIRVCVVPYFFPNPHPIPIFYWGFSVLPLGQMVLLGIFDGPEHVHRTSDFRMSDLRPALFMLSVLTILPLSFLVSLRGMRCLPLVGDGALLALLVLPALVLFA